MSRRVPLLSQVRDEVLFVARQESQSNGGRLPAEASMAERLRVSRATIREAYVQLEAEGLLARRHGVGTFFRDIPVRDDQNAHATFPRAIRAAGLTPTSRIVSIAMVGGSADLNEVFGGSRDARYHRAERVIAADGKPAVYLIDFVPSERFDGWNDLTKDDIDMIVYFQRKKLFHDGIIRTEVRAVAADPHTASMLELEPGAPLLLARATIVDHRGTPVVHSQAWYRPDLIAIRSTRRIPYQADDAAGVSTAQGSLGVAVVQPANRHGANQASRRAKGARIKRGGES